MSTAQEHNAIKNEAADGNGTAHHRKPYNYGGNPQFHANDEGERMAAFGGDFQPGLYKVDTDRKFANPAPLGLSAFALTTFVLSLINMSTDGVTAPNIVIGPAFAYGGLVQLLAGMWEMAVGNTFGATALSSYGGFWIGIGIILTPGGFNIIDSLAAADGSAVVFYHSFGFYLMGWFIFTFILLLCTLKSTVAFFFLFLTLDMAFLMLGIAYLDPSDGVPNGKLLRAGGVFGIIAAFMAWYNALAGIADPSNSFFLIPVMHFPWSDKARAEKEKVDNSEARGEAQV